MRDTVTLKGVVLSASPVGDYDKRLVILTGARGKITAFAHGVRRTKSALIAAANPFVFADFALREGRDAYSLVQADVIDYMSELPAAYPGVFYGMYFLEFASYYGREGLEAGQTVNLLYVALKALAREKMPAGLVRAVFELRLMSLNGEFAVPGEDALPDAEAREAAAFCAGAPLRKLFSLSVGEKTAEVLSKYAEKMVRRTTDRPFRSLEILKELGSP